MTAWKKTNKSRTLYKTIRERQTSFFRHINREAEENIMIIGKINDK